MGPSWMLYDSSGQMNPENVGGGQKTAVKPDLMEINNIWGSLNTAAPTTRRTTRSTTTTRRTTTTRWTTRHWQQQTTPERRPDRPAQRPVNSGNRPKHPSRPINTGNKPMKPPGGMARPCDGLFGRHLKKCKKLIKKKAKKNKK